MAIIKGYDYIRKEDTYFETTTYYDHKTGVPTQEKISLGYIDKYTGEFIPIKRTHGDGSDVHRENQIIFGKDDDNRDALYYKNMYDFCRMRLEAKNEEITKIVNKYNSFLFENGVFSDTYKQMKANEFRAKKQLEIVEKSKKEEAEKYNAKVKELQNKVYELQNKVDGVYKSLGIKVDNVNTDKLKITEIEKKPVPIEERPERPMRERVDVGDYWFNEGATYSIGGNIKYIKEYLHYTDPLTGRQKIKARTVGTYNPETREVTPTKSEKIYNSREDLIKAVDAELAEARKKIAAERKKIMAEARKEVVA